MEAPQRRLNTSQSEGSLSNYSTRLSDKRREKLMNLKRREDLKDALTTKFRDRFGHGGVYKADDEVSVASATIRSEVDKFAKLANLTEANLGRLERRMKSRASGQVRDHEMTSNAGISVYSGASVRSRSSVSLAGASLVNRKHPLEGLPPMDWTKLDEYASHVHDQDALRQQLGGKALQRKMRQDLQEQVQEKQNKKDRIEEENQRHHQNSMLELEQWKKMEEVREREKHHKIMREKADRDAQLNFDREERAKEAQQKIEEEQFLVDKIVTEMQAAQEKFEQEKQQAKDAMMKVYYENQDDLKKKAVEDKERKQREADALIEYSRAADAEEARRAAELQARMDRQNELMGKLVSSVESVKKGAGDNDHKRALAQQEEMDRNFFQAEDIKQNRLKQMRLENQQYLLRQMEEKQDRKGDDDFLQDIQCRILEQDTSEYEDAERRKTINRKVRNHEHRKDLEKQMEHKLKKSVPLMSENEMRMNAPLLHLVHKTLTNKASQPLPVVEEDEEDC